MVKFDTHKFLYNLNYEGSAKGHRVVFVNRDNIEKEVVIERIEVGASPVSCKIYDKDGNKFSVPFIRIRKVFKGDELVWDNTDVDLSDIKVIKGYK